ncbi:MAG: hypothetical protein ABS898_02985 [Psychrobacillus sp.]
MMRNFRGVVCEKKDDYYIFLTSEGEFLRGIPLVDDPMIGSEAEFQLLEAKAPFLLTQIKPKILAPILVAAIVLIFCVASLIPQQTSAYAYVQLEGEHAVEIGVDEDGQVISLRSLDEDTPIDINNWEDLALAAVLVHAVKQVGAAQDELVITTVYENETNQEVKAQVNQAVKEVKAVQSEQHINVTESSAEERKKANKNNTSIQKYKQKEQQPVKENKTSKNQQNNSSVNQQKTSVEQPKKSSVDEKQKTSVEKQQPVVPAPPPAATQKPEKEKKEHPNKQENAPKNKTHNPEIKPNPNQSKDKPKHSNDRKHKDEKQHPSKNNHKGVGPKDNNKGHDKPKNNHHNGNNQGNNHRDKNNNHRP